MTTIAKSAGRTPARVDAKAKSYATEANLNAALERLNIKDHFHLVCKTTEGRWTAIFPQSNIEGGYLCLYSQYGFWTLG